MTSRNGDRGRTGGASWSGHGNCPSGKWSYSDRSTAAAWARKTAKTSGTAGGKLRPFRCEQCPAWHLGHKPRVTMSGQMSSREFHEERVAKLAGSGGPRERHRGGGRTDLRPDRQPGQDRADRR